MIKTIAVSGINLHEGGPLRIYYQFCDEIMDKRLYEQYHFILFVHRKSLFEKYGSFFEIIELPDSRSSWLKRMNYEYRYFLNYSRTRDIELWISLHDMTPKVDVRHQITYFHNPTFSHKADYSDFKYDKKVFLFSLFYKYLYKLNVHANDYVIVQQDWISREISQMVGVNEESIVVMPAGRKAVKHEICDIRKDIPYMFFFPSVSRHFKNFEVICDATRILNSRGYSDRFQIVLTIDGTEDRYSKEIVNNNSDLQNISFTGYLSMDEVSRYYQKAECLIFPSKMETWGLPISEAKEYGLPLLVADLPYAHETVGNYGKVCFFHENDPTELADKMLDAILGKNVFCAAEYVNTSRNIVHSWEEMIKFVLKREEK